MLTLRRGREPGERRERLERASVARAQRARGVGLLLISLGVAIWLVVFLVFVALWLAGVDTGSLPSTAGFVVLAVSLALITRGRRMRVGGAERVLADQTRAPVVYLRPFEADQAKIATPMSSRLRISPRGSFEKTYEERLARTLREVGPFVAVGDPTERLPLLGAARVYAADDDWQETVDELTARAGVLVLHAGESEGLAWEVRHVIALDAPERVILSLPLEGKRKEPSRQERYDAFRRRFGDAFPRPLPESIGHCRFIHFDADWTPRLLGERGAPLPVGDGARAVALRRLAREFKITWAPLWGRMLAYGTAVLVPVVALVVLTDAGAGDARVDACVSAGVPRLLALEPPFATTEPAVRSYARADCQALEARHLLTDDGELASAEAARLRCERYVGALYDHQPPERRGARARWGEVGARYCATPAAPDPGGRRLLRIAAEVN